MLEKNQKLKKTMRIKKPINNFHTNFEQILHCNIKYKGYSICD